MLQLLIRFLKRFVLLLLIVAELHCTLKRFLIAFRERSLRFAVRTVQTFKETVAMWGWTREEGVGALQQTVCTWPHALTQV
jgi:hypothetical protein